MSLSDQDLERVDDLVDAARRVPAVTDALAGLSREEAASIHAGIVEDEGYDEIAARMKRSEAVVRQRVSRGLRNLRTALEEER